MEEQKDMLDLLELMMTPAFSVHDAHIQHVNQAARQLLIQPGTPISQLIPHSLQEYLNFTDGCLYLTLQLPGGDVGASISRINAADIFVLDQEQVELRAMALAAQDLRIPLADVMSIADRLFPSLDDANQQIQSQLSQINRKLTQLKRVILNMADASRYTGSAASRLRIVDICSLTREIFDRIEVQAVAAGMQLCHSVPQEQILCQIDEEKLERAIYNLISNAIKASSPGGIIEARLTRREKTVYLSVQDAGKGVSPAVIGSIFTRYQRQPGLESGQDGLGLGMVMVRTAAAVHGGTVLISQPSEGGTRVIMSLPIRNDIPTDLHSALPRMDYAGEKDHGLLELSDVLPPELYHPKK